MKHVVFAHRKLSFGGGERVMVEQVAALAEFPVRVSVLFRKDPDRRDLEAELRRRNPNVGEVLHLPGAWACFRWLRAHRPDLLVLCNHKGVQRALPFLPRIPTVLTLHEHYERHLRKYKGVARRVDRWILTWAFQDAVREHLGPQPCDLIHPLYPRPEVRPGTEAERRAARRELGLPEEGPVIGYVGQIDGRKDPLSTLRFAEALATRVEGLSLLFAGREEEATALDLDRAIAASPLRGRVRRLGRVADTAPALSALDCYVMTSRNEGFFPLALIEALERGVPVLAPTVGGIGTVLKDGEGGFLIPKPDDRAPIAPELLEAAAARMAPLLTGGWEAQRERAHAFGAGLTRGYDAAAAFRRAVAAWIP